MEYYGEWLQRWETCRAGHPGCSESGQHQIPRVGRVRSRVRGNLQREQSAALMPGGVRPTARAGKDRWMGKGIHPGTWPTGSGRCSVRSIQRMQPWQRAHA